MRECVPTVKRIAKYWHGKAVLYDGTVVTEEFASENDLFDKSIPVIYDCGEPECFACRRRCFKYSDKYEELLSDETDKFWDIWQSPITKGLERCHIVPHSLGGDDKDPSNYLLLCPQCHAESPDTIYPRAMFLWLYSKRSRDGSDGICADILSAFECLENNYGISRFESESLMDADFAKTIETHGQFISPTTYKAAVIGSVLDNKFKTDQILNEIRRLPLSHQMLIATTVIRENTTAKENTK